MIFAIVVVGARLGEDQPAWRIEGRPGSRGADDLIRAASVIHPEHGIANYDVHRVWRKAKSVIRDHDIRARLESAEADYARKQRNDPAITAVVTVVRN